MNEKIRSYKLSPQLKAELNFPSKRESFSKQIFKSQKINFNLSKINWKVTGTFCFIFVLVIGSYLSVKKFYEYLDTQAQQKKMAQMKEYEKRILSIEAEVKSQATDAFSFATLSQTYLKSKDVEKAEIAANIAVEKDPLWRDGYINQGQVLLSVNRFDQAKIAFEKAVGLDPLNGQAHYLLSLTYQELRDNDNAKIEFAKAKKFGFEAEIGG